MIVSIFFTKLHTLIFVDSDVIEDFAIPKAFFFFEKALDIFWVKMNYNLTISHLIITRWEIHWLQSIAFVGMLYQSG